MIRERWGSKIHYCQDHHMVRNPKTYRWKTVPADFITELLESELPVAMLARQCPGCHAPIPSQVSDTPPWTAEPACSPTGLPLA
jgi:hypothetical protein